MIVWTGFLVAFLVALVITLIFVPFLGWRRGGADNEAGLAGAVLFFFLILFLAAWAGGVWLTPFGPTIWGVSWLGFIVVAIVAALILAAAVPPTWPGARRDEIRAANEATPEEAGAAVGLGLLFWGLLFLLALAIILGYFFGPGT